MALIAIGKASQREEVGRCLESAVINRLTVTGVDHKYSVWNSRLWRFFMLNSSS